MDMVIGLHHWLDQLEHQLEPAQRRELLRQLAQQLRVNFKDRIKKQRDPDGNAFKPRKRDQLGRIRRQATMFQKIGREIKIQYTADQAEVGFGGRTAVIARVHQEGLVVRPGPESSPTQYPKRKLLGFSDQDKKWLSTQILQYLSKQ